MRQKKKIICTVTNDLTYDQRMIRICTSLSNAGYEVCLVGRLRKNSKELKQQIFNQKRLPCHFDSGKLFYIEYNIRLFFYLLFQRFNAINSIDLDTILPGYFVAKLKRKVCIYDAHEYFTELPEVIERPLVKGVWSKVAKWTIPNLKHCYTVCESLAEIFEKEYGTAFQVIRNLPFRQKENVEEKDEVGNKIILYQGVLNDGRGLEQAIEAMQQIEGAQLWLVGEGDLSQELRDLCEKLDLNKKVKFLGFISPHELKSITQQAHIGLNLLKNKGLNYYYSLANKAFDYIQACKPSINMNFPEYQKLNNRYDVFLLIDDLEIAPLAAAIQSLVDNEELYKSLKDNCKKARTELIWEEEEKKLIAIYHKVFRD